MGCACIKESIQLDKKIVNIGDTEQESQEDKKDNCPQFPSITATSKMQNRINSINTNSFFDNSYIINNSNLPDSVDFRKSSFVNRRLNDQANLNSDENINKSLIIAKSDTNKDFDDNMLSLINCVRSNPVFINEKIQEFMKYIKQDKNTNKSFFVVNNSTKINLLKGNEAFLSCCSLLNELSEKIKNKNLKLGQLEIKEDLKFPFPENNPSLCNKKEYISEKINELSKKVQNKYKLKGFHYDMSPIDAETSLIMQIVDDNNSNGKRRSAIFDDKIKYIGISHGKVRDNIFCVYMVFAC